MHFPWIPLDFREPIVIFSYTDHMKRVLAYIKIMLLAVILPVLSVNAQTSKPGHHPGRKQVVTEKYALDTVMRIPEIKQDDLYIRKTNKGIRHLFSMIYGEPYQHQYYWVVVGEDNGMSFVTHFTFFVYTNGRKILYHDNFTDSTIDLNYFSIID